MLLVQGVLCILAVYAFAWLLIKAIGWYFERRTRRAREDLDRLLTKTELAPGLYAERTPYPHWSQVNTVAKPLRKADLDSLAATLHSEAMSAPSSDSDWAGSGGSFSGGGASGSWDSGGCSDSGGSSDSGSCGGGSD